VIKSRDRIDLCKRDSEKLKLTSLRHGTYLIAIFQEISSAR